MLSVRPAAYISAMAAISATGMPAATQKAVRAFRNRNRSPTTSARPISALSRRDVEAARDRLGAGPGSGRWKCPREVASRAPPRRPRPAPGWRWRPPSSERSTRDRNSRILAHEIGAFPVGAAHLDPGDVTERVQRRTVVIRPEGERRDPPRRLRGGGPGAHAGAGRVDLACGGGSVGGRRNHGGDLGHGNVSWRISEAEGHLDHDLRRRDAPDGGPRDARIEEETRDELVREPAKAGRARPAGDHHASVNPVPPRAPAHPSACRRPSGSVGDAVDGDLHLVGGARHVQPGTKSISNGGAPLAAGRRGRGDARHRHSARAPAPRRSRASTSSRPGAVPADLDVDLVGDHVGEELRPSICGNEAMPATSISTSRRFAAGAVAGEIAQDARGLVGDCAHRLSFPCALRCARPSARAPRARSLLDHAAAHILGDEAVGPDEGDQPRAAVGVERGWCPAPRPPPARRRPGGTGSRGSPRPGPESCAPRRPRARKARAVR